MIHWIMSYKLTFSGHEITWLEIIGNLFGMGSAVLGMRRKVWAWPVGIVGNLLLFTLFLGGNPQHATMYGQIGRQVMFALVSAYGWARWARSRGTGEAAVQPRIGGWRVWLGLIAVGAVGVLSLTPLFRALGSFPPVWADAWIFTGSVLATFAMARGWVEFWLVWIAVDAVGVPTLWHAQFYPSATLYLIYGAFVLWGFVVWLRMSLNRQPSGSPLPAAEAEGVPS